MINNVDLNKQNDDLAEIILRQGQELARLREALRNIAIGGIGERYFTIDEIRAYAEDALQP